MARLASLLNERTTVRIGVTRRTTLELDPRESGLAISTRRMTLDAGHLQVRAAKRKFRLFVIEAALPISRVVTLRAVWSQLAVVLVFVTIDARCSQTQKRSARIASSDERTSRWRKLGRVVALSTVQASVLAIESKSGLAMIEGFQRRLPSH